MGDETTLNLDCEHIELMCTENREFLYDNDRSLIPMNTEPILQTVGSKMAGFKPASETTDKTKASEKKATAKKPIRKRNPLRDRLRNEAEQSAYQHLRRMIPSLQSVKKPTKLETIRNACEYIESLQKTIVELEGELGLE